MTQAAQPTAPGPLRGLPVPARMLLATLPGGGVATNPLTGLLYQHGLAPLMAKDQQLARDFAGGMVQDVVTPIGLPLQDRFAPNTPLTATMRQIGALPDRSPGQAIDLLRHSGDTPAAWLGGGLELASDPLNVAGPGAAEFARGMELARLARALGVANDPLGEATAAGVRALRNRLALRQAGEAAVRALPQAAPPPERLPLPARATRPVPKAPALAPRTDLPPLGQPLSPAPPVRTPLPVPKAPALAPRSPLTLPPLPGRAPAAPPTPLEDFAAGNAATYRTPPAPPPPVPPGRNQIIGNTARSAPASELTPIFRDLHRAIYGDRSQFSIPAMFGTARRNFTLDTLLAHPEGNAAPAYLDYLATHVQQDAKAQARLAQTNPNLLADIMALEPHPRDLETQKRTIQAMFEAGSFAPGKTAPQGKVIPTEISALTQEAPPTVATTPPSVPTLGEYARQRDQIIPANYDAPLTKKEANQLNKETGSKTWKAGDMPNPAAQQWLLANNLRTARERIGTEAIASYKAQYPEGAPVPAPALPTATATVDDFNALLHGPWSVSQYVPDAAAFAKRLGVSAERAQAWIDDAVAQGTLTYSPQGDLTFAPNTVRSGAMPSNVPEVSTPANTVGGGTLPGLPGLQAGGATFTPLTTAPLTARAREAAPFALHMQYGKLAPAEVGRIKQVDAGQGDLFGGAARVAPPEPAPAFDDKLALRQEFKAGLQDAISRGSDDEARAIVDMARDYGYTPQEADALYQDMLAGGEAPNLVDQQKQLIEQSPYAEVFKYFDPKTGDLYMRNAVTRAPLTVKVGDKTVRLTNTLRARYGEVYELPGSGYDTVAAAAMGKVGGYNPRLAADAGEFWRNAREAYGQYRQLQQGKEIAPGAFIGDIAAGGGGGGGLGVYPFPGGLTGAAGRAVLPATGAGIGAGVGYLTGDAPEERKARALQGAAIGGAAGGALEYGPRAIAAAGRAVAPGSTWRLVGEQAAREGKARQGAAVALIPKQGLFPGRGDWVNLWKRQVIETPRNWLQDETWGRVVLRALQGGATADLAPLRREAAQVLNAPDPLGQLPVSTRGLLADIGKPDYVPRLGESLSQQVRKGGDLSALQTATGEAALSLANPAAIAQNVAGVALGGVKGALRAGWGGVFRTVNDFQHKTFRLAAFNDELAGLLDGGARDFLGTLQRQGAGVSALAGRSGSFSPAEVGQVAGKAAQARWQGITDKAVALAEGRATFLMGDYGKTGAIERALGKGLPFISWAIRAYPVALQMALDHPVVALALYQYARATSQGAGQGGRPGYTAGMIPVPTSTPFVGPLLAALVPGGKGVVYVDPVGAISPVGGDVLSSADDNPGDTWYQRATKLVGRLGLPGPNPAIQAGAYLTGLDYKTPGALSRTAGIENALALLPGNPALPNVGADLLAAGRSALSPVVGPALGGQADKNAAPYDPITRRYSELVFEQTHKTLADPANRAYLVGMADPDNDLMQRARREVLLSGAAKNAASLVSPAGTATQGATAQAVKAAQDTLPPYGALDGLDPFARAQAQRQIDAAKAANPLLTLHQGETPDARATLLLTDWERQNQGLEGFWPSLYQLQLLAQKERLGLAAPGAVASEYRTMDQRNSGQLPGGPLLMPGVPLPMSGGGAGARELIRRRIPAGR